MGRKLLKSMKVEVENIKTPEIQKFVKHILMKAHEHNAIGPASSSGKYHPVADLGEAGLVRHAKSVCKVVSRLMESMPKYDNPIERDKVYAAALLHDFCKFTDDNIKHTNEDHPRLMAELIRKEYENEEDIWQLVFEEIAMKVEVHMSRWNVLKYMKGPDMKLPKDTIDDMLVPFADMIAAAKWFNLNFDKENNIV